MSTGTIVAIVVIIAIVAVIVAFAAQQRRRRQTLKTKFGPEYDRTVSENRDPRQAEELLERRQKRVEMYHLRPLRPEEGDRFAADWRREQELFVDNPRQAVANADRLVSEAMTARGYRIPDIETRIEDLSVEHPQEVEHFRTAHALAQKDASGHASTEDLRQAMQHYRAIFESLLGSHVVSERVREEVRR